VHDHTRAQSPLHVGEVGLKGRVRETVEAQNSSIRLRGRSGWRWGLYAVPDVIRDLKSASKEGRGGAVGNRYRFPIGDAPPPAPATKKPGCRSSRVHRN